MFLQFQCWNQVLLTSSLEWDKTSWKIQKFFASELSRFDVAETQSCCTTVELLVRRVWDASVKAQGHGSTANTVLDQCGAHLVAGFSLILPEKHGQRSTEKVVWWRCQIKSTVQSSARNEVKFFICEKGGVHHFHVQNICQWSSIWATVLFIPF